MKNFPLLLMAVITLIVTMAERVAAQSVPQGIHYQAVARDNTGKEMSEKTIDVRFSIIPGNPLNSAEYEELHQAIRTSKYGVFTLIIGNGVRVGGTLNSMSEIQWGQAAHFLKVEIKFENNFVDMGTMQFLSVPYALFAGKSLEPGPAGPTGPQGAQGPPGDPASDNQTLSFNGTNLSITGNPGNTVNLTSLINDADSDPANEIQYLSLKGDTLSITKGNFVTFSALDVNDADADPTNEIQDLRLVGNILKITRNGEATEVNLAPYLDNTDSQMLTWNPSTRVLGLTNSVFTIDLSRTLSFTPATNILSINGGNSVDLTSLKNDADASVTNELISTVALQGSELVITEAGTERRVNLSSNMTAFRAKKLASSLASIATQASLTSFTEVYPQVGTAFSPSSGVFTAPITGIYTFNVSYKADGLGDGRILSLYLNSELYEDIALSISGGSIVTVRSVTMRLVAGDAVNLVVYTGLSSETGTATFSGFRVF